MSRCKATGTPQPGMLERRFIAQAHTRRAPRSLPVYGDAGHLMNRGQREEGCRDSLAVRPGYPGRNDDDVLVLSRGAQALQQPTPFCPDGRQASPARNHDDRGQPS
eukprot:2832335-Rhodomonas_salina.2